MTMLKRVDLRPPRAAAAALEVDGAIRDADAEGGADGAFHQANLAAVRAHQLGDDGKAEADAAGARRAGKRLEQMFARLGTDGFARLRVGVGRGDPRRDLSDHVLSRVTGELRETLSTATTVAADAVELFMRAPILELMNRYNAAPKDEGGPPDQDANAEQ